MKILKDWTWFEKIWLLVFTSINLYLFFVWDDTLLGLISSLSGMLCVLLVAKGKISNYMFGIVQTSTYAYISFNYGLYGEFMLNGFFYFPLQFIGIYLWNKNKIRRKESGVGEDVEVRRLTGKNWVVVGVVTSISIILFTVFLNSIGGNTTGIDSMTTILSIVAQILMLMRFAEQWLFWISVNILSIIMWFIALGMADVGNDHTMVVMFSAFLVNSTYGYINWLRMEKKQINKPRGRGKNVMC